MDPPPYRIPTRPGSDYDSPTSSSTSATTSIQNLSSILNNPLTAPTASSWSLWPTTSPSPDPLLTSSTSSSTSVTSADFHPYLSSISDPYSRFADIVNHSATETLTLAASGGLAACLREVPSLFFEGSFDLSSGATFEAAVPSSERLTHYLDVVETHLVREIALRSDSFFEAQGRLQGLNGEIVEACGRISKLREGIGGIEDGLVGPARKVRELNAAREGLVVLHQKLAVILYVAQALSALKLVSVTFLQITKKGYSLISC